MAKCEFETSDGLKISKVYFEGSEYELSGTLSGTITLDGTADMFLLTGDTVEVTNMDANYLNVMPDPKGKWGLKDRFSENTLDHVRCYLHNYIAKWKLEQEETPIDLSTFLWHEAIGEPDQLSQIGHGVFHTFVFKRPESTATISDFTEAITSSLSELYAGVLDIVGGYTETTSSMMMSTATDDLIEIWNDSILNSATPISPVNDLNVNCSTGLTTDTIRPP